jgi:hypothetical protein
MKGDRLMASNLTPVHNYKSADVIMITLTTEDFTKLVLGKSVYINDETNDLIIMINREEKQ